ncbi:MAG: hypothetical protein P8J42_03850, partial [Pseudomonadales bacterium]|nr:hypothetical protein [Pseudomonadales bacterium]
KSSVLQLLSAVHQYNHHDLSSAAAEDKAESKTESKTESKADINEVIKELRRIAKPGSALFIISDFIGLNDDGIKQLHLLKKHCDVNAIFISDPMEKQLPARSGHSGYQFTDGNKRQWFDTNNHQLLAAFTQRFTERSEHLTQQLAAHGIPTIAISTDNSALDILRSHYHSSSRSSSRAKGHYA